MIAKLGALCHNHCEAGFNILTDYIDCKDAYLKGQTTSGIYTMNPDNQTAFQEILETGESPIFHWGVIDIGRGGWTLIQHTISIEAGVSMKQVLGT